MSKDHTDEIESHYIQAIHIVGKLTKNKNLTEDNIKKADFLTSCWI